MRNMAGLCTAVDAEEAVPRGQQTTLKSQYSEDAEQSGSRQALLSTAPGNAGTGVPERLRPSMEEQPWEGIDSVAGACRAVRMFRRTEGAQRPVMRGGGKHFSCWPGDCSVEDAPAIHAAMRTGRNLLRCVGSYTWAAPALQR